MENLNFGKKLIEIRNAKGLTQEEVAEKCKISVRTIQRIESGNVKPRAFTIKLISGVLDFDFFETANTGCVVDEKNQDLNLLKHTVFRYIKNLFNLKTNAMKKVSILTTAILGVGLSLFIFVLGISAQSPEKKGQRPNYIITEDLVEVAFTNELTFDSLVYIREDLKAKGITIYYKLLKFDEKNQLLSISCDIDCNDGFKGSFSTGISSLDATRTGFYRNYSKKSKSPFGTGCLDCE